MIFFLDNKASVIKSLPSIVHQGSSGANDIFVCAPITAEADVWLKAQKPDGVILPPVQMTKMSEIPGMTDGKRTYSVWGYTMPNSMTNEYGTLSISVKFVVGAARLESETFNVSVQRGIPEALDETPDADWYDEVLSELQNTLKKVSVVEQTVGSDVVFAGNNTITGDSTVTGKIYLDFAKLYDAENVTLASILHFAKVNVFPS